MDQKNMTAEGRKPIRTVLSWLRPSRILDALALLLCRWFVTGFWGKLFTAYTSEENVIRRAFQKYKKQRTVHREPHRIDHRVTRFVERVFFARGLKRLRYKLLKCPFGYYSDMILIYAASSLVANFLALFFSDAPVTEVVQDISSYAAEAFRAYLSDPILWINIGLLVLFSLFALPIRARSFHDVKMGSVFLSAFFERALGAKGELTEELQNKNSDLENGVQKSRLLQLLLFLLGLSAGILSAFVPPFHILLIPAVLLTGSAIIRTPEAGLILSVFMLPMLQLTGNYNTLHRVSSGIDSVGALFSALGTPTVVLAGFVLFTGFSYLIKVLRKKRLFRFGLLDAAVLLFGLLTVFYGIYPYTTALSVAESVLTLVMMTLYFLSVNLLRNEIWISRVLLALQFTAFVTLSSGIYVFFFGIPDLGWFPLDHLSGSVGNMEAFFGGSSFIGAYLVMLLPLSLVAVFSARSVWSKVFGAMCLPEILFVAFFLPSKIPFVFCLVGIVVFALLCTYRTLYAAPIAAAGAGVVYHIIPNGISLFTFLERFFFDTFARGIYLWDQLLTMGVTFSLLGEGYGLSRFYELTVSSKAPFDAGFFMRLFTAMGIPGLVVFCIASFLFMQMCLEELKLSKGSHMRLAVAGGYTSVLTAILYGFFMPVWTDFRMIFFFWLAVGLTAAYRRVSAERREDRTMIRRQPMTGRAADIVLY